MNDDYISPDPIRSYPATMIVKGGDNITFSPSRDNTIRVERDWISVNERLPEKNQQVLIFSSGINKSISMSTWMEYEFSDELHWDGQLSYLVTHWMPLPNPPVINES